MKTLKGKPGWGKKGGNRGAQRDGKKKLAKSVGRQGRTVTGLRSRWGAP